MPHIRTHILQKTVAHLDAAPALSGRVYKAPFVPGKAEMPACVVRVGNEVVNRSTVDWESDLDRRFQLEIELIGNSASENVIEKLDALAVVVEQAVHGDGLTGYLDDLLTDPLVLTGIDTTPDKESSVPAARLMLSFEGMYSTSQVDPETAT